MTESPEQEISRRVRKALGPDAISCRCGFCGKDSDEVRHMVAGPTANICNECVHLYADIFRERGKTARSALPWWRRLLG